MGKPLKEARAVPVQQVTTPAELQQERYRLEYDEGYRISKQGDAHESPKFVGIPMLLWCPSCGERHIDVGEFATKPHHTHACQKCGMVWRPALVATNGVQFLPGFKSV